MMIVHVTDVSPWGLYTKCMVCMLQVGVHCASIICTIAFYGIGIIFRIVIVNMELVLLYLSFETQCCRYVSFLLNSCLLVSADLISVCISLQECGSQVSLIGEYAVLYCLLAILVWLFDWYSVLELVLGLELSTGNLDWKLWSSTGNPHICRYGQNRFFYNCSLISHLLFYYVILLM